MRHYFVSVFCLGLYIFLSLFMGGRTAYAADCALRPAYDFVGGYYSTPIKYNVAQTYAFSTPAGGCTFSAPRYNYYNETMPEVGFVVNGETLFLTRNIPSLPMACMGRYYTGPEMNYQVGPEPYQCLAANGGNGYSYVGSANSRNGTPIGGYEGAMIRGPVSMKGGVAAEDKVIDDIQKRGLVTIQVGNDSDPDKQISDIPATNCVKLSGNGPIKVVFMRGDGGQRDLGDFLGKIDTIIKKGFNTIDPFAASIGMFSFYADLRKIPQAGMTLGPIEVSNDNSIKSKSSCGTDARLYALLFDDAAVYQGWTTPFGGNVTYLNVNDHFTEINGSQSTNGMVVSPFVLPGVVIHEAAHIIGDLNDEYITATWSIIKWARSRKNCAIKPSASYRGSDNIMYGSPETPQTVGCDAITLVIPTLPPISVPVFRPSKNSIMRSDYASGRFNVISCGYIMAGLRGEPTDKSHAQRYWLDYWTDAQGRKQPGCGPTFVNGKPTQGPMNTVIEGIPDMSSAPTVNRIMPSN